MVGSVREDLVTQIQKLTADRGEAADRAAKADMFWRWKIQAAIKAGLPVSEIANAAGISRQRVYQIRDGRR